METMSAASQPIMNNQVATARTSELKWPRIALVTPVFNSGKYIEQTIRSVLAQGYPNLDYFIVDGGSTDGTLDIIRRYESQISGWIGGPDSGMYDAINKGFARTSGEIMGWISATDQLHVGGLSVLGSIFREFPDVQWITGKPTIFSEEGMTVVVAGISRWARYRFLAGANRAIQQESTFWRRSLWEKAGSYVDASGRYGVVSDFELWVRFFRYAKLYSADALIGGYRMHRDSVGYQDLQRCYRIHDEVIEAELDNVTWGRKIRLFRRLRAAALRTPLIGSGWRHFVEPALYSRPGPDLPPVIRYDYSRGWCVGK